MIYLLYVFLECVYLVGIECGVVLNEVFLVLLWYDVDYEFWLVRFYSREGEGVWCVLKNDGI